MTQLMMAALYAQPMWLKVGNCSSGTVAATLFSRMKKNRPVRYGTYFMNSWLPIASRAIELRTKLYPSSPANCSLLGTTAALRDAPQKNHRMTTTVSADTSTGLVNHSTPSMIGGVSKLCGPGAMNSVGRPAVTGSPLASCSSRTPWGKGQGGSGHGGQQRQTRCGSGPRPVPEVQQQDGEPGTEDDAHREEELRAEEAIQPEPDAAVQHDTADQVGQDPPAVARIGG